MKSRALMTNDLEKLEQLHNEYNPDMEFPSFLRMLNAFVIEDYKDEIIMAGAIELIGEIVLVTNKSKPLMSIGRALLEAKAISEFTAHHFGIKDLYAFVNNDDYAKHLIQHGFIDHPFKTLRLRTWDNQKQ